MKTAASSTLSAPPAKAKPKAATATPAATSSIRDRELDKRRKVFKQSFDSPLKVKWGSPTPAELQSELIDLLIACFFSSAPTTHAFHRGLQSTFKLLAARICNPLKQLAVKVPALAIVLFRGDLDHTLAGPDLYGWLPGVVQLAKCAGHAVHLFVVTEVGANVKVASAIHQQVEKKGGNVVARCACIAIELGSDSASADLCALAARFQTPSVPFYTSASDGSNLATFTNWAKLVNKPSLLSPNIKLLETSAPIVDRKKQKESKTAAKIHRAANRESEPKPIRPKSGPLRSRKARADKHRQLMAAEIARGGPLIGTEFGCVLRKFESPSDQVRAMLAAKVALREARERHVVANKKRVVKVAKAGKSDDARQELDADVGETQEDARDEKLEQDDKIKASKKRSRPSGEITALSAPAMGKSKKRRTTKA